MQLAPAQKQLALVLVTVKALLFGPSLSASSSNDRDLIPFLEEDDLLLVELFEFPVELVPVVFPPPEPLESPPSRSPPPLFI